MNREQLQQFMDNIDDAWYESCILEYKKERDARLDQLNSFRESTTFKDIKNEQCSLYQVVCINSSIGKINNRLKALEELSVEISNVTKADGEIMFSFEPKDLTGVCGVFKIKKKAKKVMSEEQKQKMTERLSAFRFKSQ